MDIIAAANSIEAGQGLWYIMNAMVFLFITFVFLVIMLAFFSIIFRWMRSYISKDERYNLFEVGALRKTAEKVGIDLSYEKKLLELQNGKTFRRQLEEKIMKDTFKKDGEE